MGSDTYHVHVVVTESQTVEGLDTDVPIGDGFLDFATDTPLPQARDAIIAQAREIRAMANRAKQARQALGAAEWPEV